VRFYLGAYLKEQRHIFGVCPNPECSRISRLADIEISYKSRYQPDWLDSLETEQLKWERKIEEFLAAQEEIKKQSKAKAEKRVLPQKLKSIAPAFASMNVNPRDVRVLSHPIDFVAFDGLSRDALKRIVLLDAKQNAGSRAAAQASIESAIDRERYDWGILRVDNEGRVRKE